MLQSNYVLLPDKPQYGHLLRETTIENHDSRHAFSLRQNGLLYIPRFFGVKRLKPENLLRKDYEEGKELPPHKFYGTLRTNVPQQEAVDKIMKRLTEDDEHLQSGYVVLGCGAGKTTISLYVLALLRRKTLVIVNNSLLMDQWTQRLSQFLPTATVGILQGSIRETNNDVVVAMLQTLCKLDRAVADVGFVIFDECHHVPTNSIQTALGRLGYTPRRMLGLTATPNRRDGCGRALTWILGPKIFEYAGSVSDLTTTYVKVDWTTTVVPRYIDKLETKLNLSALNSDLASEKERNLMIKKLVVNCLQERRKILVLTDRVFHISILHRLLDDCGAVVGKYVSANKRKAMDEIHTFDVILSTYQMFREGIDVPHLDTLVLANPVTNVQQCVGRIQRAFPGKKNPVVVDIVDSIDVLRRYYYKRLSYYKKAGIRSQGIFFCQKK